MHEWEWLRTACPEAIVLEFHWPSFTVVEVDFFWHPLTVHEAQSLCSLVTSALGWIVGRTEWRGFGERARYYSIEFVKHRSAGEL